VSLDELGFISFVEVHNSDCTQFLLWRSNYADLLGGAYGDGPFGICTSLYNLYQLKVLEIVHVDLGL
jgi:hypothetical protein